MPTLKISVLILSVGGELHRDRIDLMLIWIVESSVMVWSFVDSVCSLDHAIPSEFSINSSIFSSILLPPIKKRGIRN
ncbi:hypothetical protein ES332_D09G051500v1 [Gossypium tomentosum]|uniref:Uncharacterized protein n=1 Tax=Gossypium tomentosum TaxID=34277 RepID=A0A5D2JDT4_GOSTO|nr:hypothetical protein ES332_D09G051500v1 [Gossypium tomentosum]